MTIKDFFLNDRFALDAGVELLDVKNGTACARMAITDRHLNGGDVCQGGAIFTLADLAFAAAVNSHAKLTLSIWANIQFFKAERSGYLYAEAKEVSNQGKLVSAEVRITNEAGDLVALFEGMGYNKGASLPFEAVQ
jgi:acyl-CoA thioesterase